MRLVHRHDFPENLLKVTREEDFPAMDVFIIFICTADPDKEPPMSVVNTALSLMAYDYPAEKLSVYVSDDGGSALTLFAFVEAAKFGSHWSPFCRRNKEVMYESMKERVENVVDLGKVTDDYITNEQERQPFNKWTQGFTRQEHPTVLLEIGKDRDITGQSMPNLIYVSRQKSRTSPHHFKAGALNVLVRVSAVLTNAPMILTLDCDMYSNDPQTPYSMLCYLFDTTITPELGYVQFPQRFHGLHKNDIYACELRHEFLINSAGLNGLAGPNHVGTGCFFSRRVFFGGRSSFVSPEIPELRPDHVVKKSIQAQSILAMAHQVADCKYEDQTNWGSKMGFRYGSLVEDFYTGYRLQCEGWRSVFCHANRPAFLGDAPITLNDALNQIKRWSVGLLEVGFSKYSPLTFGIRAMGPIMGHCYANYAFWPIWSIPLTIYAFLPQLALVNGISIFPKCFRMRLVHRHDFPENLLKVTREEDPGDGRVYNIHMHGGSGQGAANERGEHGAVVDGLRVSAVLTNAPIILTLDCDMYSNDPQTSYSMLCYLFDTTITLELGTKRAGRSQSCWDWMFFSHRVFFRGPSSFVSPEIPELRPDHVVKKSIQAQSILAMAHQVADCKYEDQTNWGSKMGFRYGSLVEDFYTGYRLQCEGWRSVFCHPNRPAFLGDAPITLNDALNQIKRWSVGLLEVGFSKYSPLTFGVWAMGPIMGHCYADYAFWPIWSIPLTIYAFLPQLALVNGISIFPKVSDTWFFLYAFLVLGTYVRDCLDFILFGGTFQRWWNDQRIWMLRGVTCFLFRSIELLTNRLGIAKNGFNLTSKVLDGEQSKRYDQGTFEFGVESPMFVPLSMVAIVNLIAFFRGLVGVFRGGDFDGLFVQIFVAGFVVVNCWPIYEAMVLRTDKGRMPTKTTLISTFLAWTLYSAASHIVPQI
ncbi:hypothetical protein RHSIM_Rhsim07G0081100 [Rhododendron simsii]|uniref:Cellulose synthase-like protein G3 n=1 Tax=Rhododendron simsii TaxID=118357 RepID=A0A834LID6_RHOSS|nr:hypothetical protein RHSIM_Rhsim07G0081100 [Rhododendron simsii]